MWPSKSCSALSRSSVCGEPYFLVRYTARGCMISKTVFHPSTQMDRRVDIWAARESPCSPSVLVGLLVRALASAPQSFEVAPQSFWFFWFAPARWFIYLLAKALALSLCFSECPPGPSVSVQVHVQYSVQVRFHSHTAEHTYITKHLCPYLSQLAETMRSGEL